MKFKDPHPGYASRSIVVTEIPTIGTSIVIEELLITIQYAGPSSGTNGIALDGYIMPLLRAAPDLSEAIMAILSNPHAALAIQRAGLMPQVQMAIAKSKGA